MSDNVGLTTPRGSGTSGYVQRNLSHLRPRDAPYPSPNSSTNNTDPTSLQKYRQRKPDAEILAHDRLREIESQVFDLRDKLEDEGVEEEEIESRCEGLRRELTEGAKGKGGRGEKDGVGNGKGGKGRLKNHQVHEMAAMKIEESERLRRALGIREGYEEGSHWRRGEERLREGLEEEGKGKEEGKRGGGGDGREGKGLER